jgi:ATP-binding cassette, subfamily C (CFTR/MRP), member 1
MGHSRILASHSGASTPRGDDETLVSTPPSEQETLDAASSVQGSLDKLQRKRSWRRAPLAEQGSTLRAPTQPTGTKQEHTERGRVKLSVYTAYIQAASIPGFVFFLICVVLQQASQVLANVTLKQWGEHNQEAGGNSNMSSYLVLYGLCSTSTILASLAGTILIFVFCSLRSAKYLHNFVSLLMFIRCQYLNLVHSDVDRRHACTSEFL